MIHLLSLAISRELKGRTRTATFTDDMAAVYLTVCALQHRYLCRYMPGTTVYMRTGFYMALQPTSNTACKHKIEGAAIKRRRRDDSSRSGATYPGTSAAKVKTYPGLADEGVELMRCFLTFRAWCSGQVAVEAGIASPSGARCDCGRTAKALAEWWRACVLPFQGLRSRAVVRENVTAHPTPQITLYTT
ncbi:unnamed protein product [Pieris macdunnoughi]|uniref:Uncharacterized protein n=1 Tax=Pieris macdunnoughi TaxID=345717 RepID=A0A821WR08_9NEOP|nr:unnamed protein product [Pieris macdunnoughi]